LSDLDSADLSHANLSHADLSQADLSEANLTHANLNSADLNQADLGDAILSHADLTCADLGDAILSDANLSHANLFFANLIVADLSGADFNGADLNLANLNLANLRGADLSQASLARTIFGDVDLTETKGLNECRHRGPSVIDFQTLSRFKDLPISFLRGCGLPDKFIDYLPSLRGEAFQFYSCFISYSTKDQTFADRLHADLQNKGVRCWFAPHDLPIGAKTLDAIDAAIRLKDKLLLILSKSSIDSDWVENEVSAAYAEERSRKQVVLVPIRMDNTAMSTTEPWARMLREQRNIGDFRHWRKPAEYQKSLDRLLRDLNASKNA
jgi:uncharacterized protein YjbI with pentapeptide repeats